MSDERLRQLMERARQEAPPRVDVTARVMASVRAERRVEGGSIAPLAWFAAASVVAAVPAGFVALSAWEIVTSPMLSLLGDVTWWLP